MPFYLSKSQYCTGISCPRALWLKKNRPELSVAESSAIAEAGKKVGELARSMFGDYELVEFSPDKVAMAHETRELLARGVRNICEASFIYEGLYCAVDILVNLGNNCVEVYEVKAESKPKGINYDDIAFQLYVLKKAGMKVKSVNLVTLNKEYVRHGELDLPELFRIYDVTAEAESRQISVGLNLQALEGILSRGEPQDLCDGCAAKDCSYWEHCSEGLPVPNIFSINGNNLKKKMDYYRNGIVSYEDLLKLIDNKKDSKKGKDKGKEKVKRQIDVELSGEPYIDMNGIKETLDRLSYPLYFLDFETFSEAIPPFDGISPYCQIPFQYSLHYVEERGGELKHEEFLGQPGEDPQRALAEKLCRDIPRNVCTTAYHASFEKDVIAKLAGKFEDLSEHLMSIHDHIEDLEIPFKNMYYLMPAMSGLSSIKLVLPALYPDDPELDYHNLEDVHNGGEASASFFIMNDMAPEDVARLRMNLLKYCGLDTLAMVKVWEKLDNAVYGERELYKK